MVLHPELITPEVATFALEKATEMVHKTLGKVKPHTFSGKDAA